MTTFGKLSDGREARLFTLQNSTGLRAEISDYGGTIVRLFVPDRHGEPGDVVLGFDRVEEYAARSPYFGCIVGRVANRITGGRFTLDGRTYELARNNQPNGIACHLHGGSKGFDKVLWQAEPDRSPEGESLRLSYHSPDGEEGYPGALDVTVTYTVTDGNALVVAYQATTDKPTPINLTNHAYFNLLGHDSGSILAHAVTLAASHYTPVNEGLIPIGRLDPVEGTPFDFRAPRTIGDGIDQADEQLRLAGGYDHNFVLDKPGGELGLAARLFEPKSGRMLEVLTTEPGVQFYSGNFLNGTLQGKGGCVYPHRGGLCLETQHFPDSPNQASFPSILLRPGETFRSTTVHRFSAR
jgi:aldose 1-epimerase